MRHTMVLALALALACGLGAPAKAADVQHLAYAALTLCVLDQDTGQPLLGARLRDAEAHVVAMTDGEGQALVPARCMDEDVLSVTRTGYPMVLVKGASLREFTLVKMRHFTAGVPRLHFTLN